MRAARGDLAPVAPFGLDDGFGARAIGISRDGVFGPARHVDRLLLLLFLCAHGRPHLFLRYDRTLLRSSSDNTDVYNKISAIRPSR